MIKTLIAIALLAPSLAFANLGDTHEQSTARYGKTFFNGGFTGLSTYAPKGKGWIIYEWFNENGIVECIAYYQVSGSRINQSQMDQLMITVNGIHANRWDIVSDDASGKIWMSADMNWRAELSWDGSMGNKPMHRLVLSTQHGFLGMQAALGVPGYQNSTSTATNDLPVSL
jgi:hypothetical protein